MDDGTTVTHHNRGDRPCDCDVDCLLRIVDQDDGKDP